jgi:hypothetical protein
MRIFFLIALFLITPSLAHAEACDKTKFAWLKGQSSVNAVGILASAGCSNPYRVAGENSNICVRRNCIPTRINLCTNANNIVVSVRYDSDGICSAD